MKPILVFALLILASSAALTQPKKELLYVGTYSIRNSQGIYVFEFNRAKNTLQLVQTISTVNSPNFLALAPDGKHLYSINHGSVAGHDKSGSASSFNINPKTGKLTLLNQVPSYGLGPCHIALDKKGEWAFISNYLEGNLVVLPVLQDGSLGSASDSKKYYGNSVNKFRQDQPHIHSATVSADNRFVYVADLGTDKIYTYALDAQNGRLISTDFDVSLTPGAGPRHLTLHPNGQLLYCAEELTSTVGILQRDVASGALKVLQDTVASLPPMFKEPNTSADIHTDPKGKFLYMSNRGHDALTLYYVQSSGKLTLGGYFKTMGKTPRNFIIDPTGKFLLVANQDGDNIVIFRINPQTGKLTYTGQQVKVPSPVCLQWYTAGK